MKRPTMVILGVAALGYYGVAASSVPANAEPWGHSAYGTNIHAGNCDCAVPEPAPQQAAEQKSTTIAKQTNPSLLPNGDGSAATKQR